VRVNAGDAAGDWVLQGRHGACPYNRFVKSDCRDRFTVPEATHGREFYSQTQAFDMRKVVNIMAFDTQKAIAKGGQALTTTGPAAAVGAVIGYGLPGALKELRGNEEIVAAVSTTVLSVLFNVIRNWWKHRYETQ
jgi:hypothetical protein